MLEVLKSLLHLFAEGLRFAVAAPIGFWQGPQNASCEFAYTGQPAHMTSRLLVSAVPVKLMFSWGSV